MPTAYLGSKNEPPLELAESPDLIAVRTRSRRPITRTSGNVPTPASGEVSDGTLVAKFPDAGVEVYRVPTQERSVEERKVALRAAPDTRFAGSVLIDPTSGEPVLYTENLYVRFEPTLDPEVCEAVLREHGLTVKRPLDFAANAYFAEAPEGTGQRVFDIASELLKRPDVIYAHPELIRERARKTIFPQQWHLAKTVVNGVTVDASANVAAAHLLTRGEGTTIAVIDDGVDIDHVEFAGPGKVVAPRNATRKTDDPRPMDQFGTGPDDGDNHGTACAGVACANGTDGASGVAPKAKLMPILLQSGLGSVNEAEAFKWAADHGADVISCSWGPQDGKWWDLNDPAHKRKVPLPASTRDALDYCLTTGRGGKGCVVLFAAGNGNESVDNDGYASAPQVMAVAACNDRGTRSVYSDFGNAIWCAFPSSDQGLASLNHQAPLTPGIWTTDRSGTAAGYNPDADGVAAGDAAGNYTNSFGGTSSACPGAAGVAALVLSANPALSHAEVRDILKRCCDRIDQSNGQYDATGRSPKYGFGRLNAETAVKLAKAGVGGVSTTNKLVNAPIPDLGKVEATVAVAETATAQKVAATVKLTHTYIGDLVVTLIPPAATGVGPVVLHDRAGGSRHDLDMVYDAANVPKLGQLNGKKCNGTWTFRVEDKAAEDSGTLVQIGVQVFVPPAGPRSTNGSPPDGQLRTDAASTPKSPKTAKSPRPAARKPRKRTKPGY